jgi:predicted alpha/beta hydrolase family esterase
VPARLPIIVFCSLIEIQNGGHLKAESGYTEFPEILKTDIFTTWKSKRKIKNPQG